MDRTCSEESCVQQKEKEEVQYHSETERQSHEGDLEDFVMDHETRTNDLLSSRSSAMNAGDA